MKNPRGPGARDPAPGQNALPDRLHEEPEPLSVDEFLLWRMQAREDAECGADEHNRDKFGEDAGMGWSFQENVLANVRIQQSEAHDMDIGACAATSEIAGGRAELTAALQVLRADAPE